jgi:hypothetical protein
MAEFLLHFCKERAEKRQNVKNRCLPYFSTGKAVKPVMQQIKENLKKGRGKI